jgi:hypothetical protein
MIRGNSIIKFFMLFIECIGKTTETTQIYAGGCMSGKINGDMHELYKSCIHTTSATYKQYAGNGNPKLFRDSTNS